MRRYIGSDNRCSIFIFIGILLCLLIVTTVASCSSAEPVITITPRTTSANIGDKVTFDYKITGVDGFEDLHAEIGVYISEDLNTWQVGAYDSVELSELEGSFDCIVRFGYAVCAELDFEDKNGQYYTVNSSKVVINDYVPQIPKIVVKARADSVNIGDTVTFDYSITNADGYQDLHAEIGVYTTTSLNEWQTGAYNSIELTSLTGSFDCKTRFGYGICATINLKDKNGQWYEVNSNRVIINGYVPRIPQITVTPRTYSAGIGDTVTFDYSISNIEQFKDLHAEIGVYTTDAINECQFSGDSYRELTTLEGSFDYQVKYGYGICAEMYISDMNGQFYHFRSDAVLIRKKENLLILPDDLVSIESGAFANDDDIDGVVMPSGIDSIADDAFGDREQLIIYGIPGTEAEFFANRHDGYTFVDSRSMDMNGK